MKKIKLIAGIALTVFAVLQIIFPSAPILVNGVPALSAGFLGSIAASSSGTFTTTYLPQFLGFTATTVPTNFQVEVNGKLMSFNLDGAGLNAMSNIRQENRVTNTYLFQLADGLINGVNCIWNITNAVASQLNIYGWSPIKSGDTLWKYTRLSVLAGATVEVDDFAYLAAPAAAAGDRFQISYEDGSVDSMTREEINYHLGYYQGDLTSKYNIDNINPARIKRAYFTGAAAQTLYKMSYDDTVV